jgi:hypothetical protein
MTNGSRNKEGGQKLLESNKNENTVYQNLRDTVKAGKFIAMLPTLKTLRELQKMI